MKDEGNHEEEERKEISREKDSKDGITINVGNKGKVEVERND